MTARITDRLRTWWLGLDNAVFYARLRLRIVTSRADADDVVQWAAGEFRRLDAEDLAGLLVREWSEQRRRQADADALVRQLRLPYELSDEMKQELLCLRDALRGQRVTKHGPVSLAGVDPAEVIAAAENLLGGEPT